MLHRAWGKLDGLHTALFPRALFLCPHASEFLGCIEGDVGRQLGVVTDPQSLV
jgi:hypothetical protein